MSKNRLIALLVFNLFVVLCCAFGAVAAVLVMIGCFVRMLNGEDMILWLLIVNVGFFAMHHIMKNYKT